MYVISNRIGTKFGKNRSLLHVNVHRLTESELRFDATLSRRRVDHDVISRRNVLPSAKCTLLHMQPASNYFCLQFLIPQYFRTCCLSNALHSSIGQNLKSHTCPVSDIRSPMSDVRCSVRVWRTSNGHNSATRHPIDFVFRSRLVFFSKDRLALFNLTAHELHELYLERHWTDSVFVSTCILFIKRAEYVTHVATFRAWAVRRREVAVRAGRRCTYECYWAAEELWCSVASARWAGRWAVAGDISRPDCTTANQSSSSSSSVS